MNDETSLCELASILIEAALINEELLMREAASKDKINEAASMRRPQWGYGSINKSQVAI